jgi:hypothetical protein
LLGSFVILSARSSNNVASLQYQHVKVASLTRDLPLTGCMFGSPAPANVWKMGTWNAARRHRYEPILFSPPYVVGS